ncbi:hypothetical protein AVDCRST_MAG81-3829 [uncultured Synechococcales cyanobacterium]|uniref:Uncharacterized protein n=1 Tax=uncultured Synechococcales cyanobacterium TaxID=1936017 RepID=A0A6J4VS78_9CYAN|nr:hypothetical protein AVDCRST_MAG81-3829 [uncultured Synechococcales cyanobacterium]
MVHLNYLTSCDRCWSTSFRCRRFLTAETASLKQNATRLKMGNVLTLLSPVQVTGSSQSDNKGPILRALLAMALVKSSFSKNS